MQQSTSLVSDEGLERLHSHPTAQESPATEGKGVKRKKKDVGSKFETDFVKRNIEVYSSSSPSLFLHPLPLHPSLPPSLHFVCPPFIIPSLLPPSPQLASDASSLIMMTKAEKQRLEELLEDNMEMAEVEVSEHTRILNAPSGARVPSEHILDASSGARVPRGHILDASSGARVPRGHILDASSGARVPRGHILDASSGVRVPRGHILHALSGARVPREHILHALSGARVPREHILHALSGARVPREHILHALSGARVPREHILHALSGARVIYSTL